MIGVPVTEETLKKLLLEEEMRISTVVGIKAELRTLEPGGCLAYSVFDGGEQSFSLAVSMLHLTDVFTIERPNKVYVYRKPKE